MAEATIDAGHEIWDLQDLALMGQSMQTSVTNYVWYRVPSDPPRRTAVGRRR